MNKLTNHILNLFVLVLLYACSTEKDIEIDFPESKKQNYKFLNQKQAADIASKFIKAHDLLDIKTKSANLKLELVHTNTANKINTKGLNSELTAYYIFNIGEKGFIIVSSNKTTKPILGYSTTSSFEADNIPVNLASVLNTYELQIKKAYSLDLPITKNSTIERTLFLEGNNPLTRNESSIEPLLGNIAWEQEPFYNKYCPGGTPVGCVAIATGQILRYYKYPSKSNGYSSYIGYGIYGKQEFNYDYTINWDLIPNKLTKYSAKKKVDETAKLCYGIAVAMKMEFGTFGSASSQREVPTILNKHYGYPKMSNAYRINHSDSEWKNVILRELKAGRPVQYAGYRNSQGGHSFVCDGYKSSTGFFHFNWGWGGKSNGYFSLDALNPKLIGTGGSTGGYNDDQYVLTGFEPPANGGIEDDNDGDIDNSKDEYCTPKVKSSEHVYIKNVGISRMSNTTKGNKYKNYAFNQDQIVYASSKDEFYINLSSGFSNKAYDVYWKVWLDVNDDKQFSENEVLIKDRGRSGVSKQITLPKLNDGLYRIRVSMKYGSYPSPCESIKHGEVEDYSLIIY